MMCMSVFFNYIPYSVDLCTWILWMNEWMNEWINEDMFYSVELFQYRSCNAAETISGFFYVPHWFLFIAVRLQQYEIV